MTVYEKPEVARDRKRKMLITKDLEEILAKKV